MRLVLRALVLAALAGAIGCKAFVARPKGQSPLSPLAASPDMVTLEIYSAPIPAGDPKLAVLWSEADEQSIPADLRRRLRQNGLRVGIAGPHVSDALAQLLNVTDRPISAEERRQVPLDAEQVTTLRVRQFQFRKRNELAVSEVYDQISLLRCTGGEVEGKNYQKAEARFDLRLFPESGARVRLEMRPELFHGDFKQRFSGSEGVFRMEPARSIESFDDLKFTATLSAGQMLLLTCEPDQPGSIGHCFFTHASADKPTQKLWILRMAQAAPDRMFYEEPKDSEDPSSDVSE